MGTSSTAEASIVSVLANILPSAIREALYPLCLDHMCPMGKGRWCVLSISVCEQLDLLQLFLLRIIIGDIQFQYFVS